MFTDLLSSSGITTKVLGTLVVSSIVTTIIIYITRKFSSQGTTPIIYLTSEDF